MIWDFSATAPVISSLNFPGLFLREQVFGDQGARNELENVLRFHKGLAAYRLFHGFHEFGGVFRREGCNGFFISLCKGVHRGLGNFRLGQVKAGLVGKGPFLRQLKGVLAEFVDGIHVRPFFQQQGRHLEVAAHGRQHQRRKAVALPGC